jgi:cellulose synthase/poly-beta-1,6-N-acetylglucosamine synthase-like glycosyltransferase
VFFLLIHNYFSKKALNCKAVPQKYIYLTKDCEEYIECLLRLRLLKSWFYGKNIVIIVLDDSSSDETVAIVKRLMMWTPNIILLNRVDWPLYDFDGKDVEVINCC